MPRALLADDEAHLLDYLQHQLQQLWPELKIVAKAANGLDALRLIDELAPDIAFLDIRMPGLSGLDVARRLLADGHLPHIVFVTAYDQYAIDAFEQSAQDYLLKPVNLARLEKTVAKLKAALALSAAKPGSPGQAGQPHAPLLDHSTEQPIAQKLAHLLAQLTQQLAPGDSAPVPLGSATPANATPARLQWIRAAHGEETRLIAVDEVIYFQSNDKYTSVFTQEGESLIRTPLRELQAQLDPAQFWQIHRSTVVAVRHIASTKRDFRARLLVRLKGRPEELVVSRNYVDLFKQM
jgi:DNA-binding LytR/AlgR family response regulator